MKKNIGSNESVEWGIRQKKLWKSITTREKLLGGA